MGILNPPSHHRRMKNEVKSTEIRNKRSVSSSCSSHPTSFTFLGNPLPRTYDQAERKSQRLRFCEKRGLLCNFEGLAERVLNFCGLLFVCPAHFDTIWCEKKRTTISTRRLTDTRKQALKENPSVLLRMPTTTHHPSPHSFHDEKDTLKESTHKQ